MNEDQIIACLHHVSAGGRKAEQGLDQLFQFFGARIKAFFRRHRMNDEEAADLLQETFIKVYRHADKFQGQSKVSTWIWTIARNCMLDYLRTKKPDYSLDEMLDSGESHEALVYSPAHEDEDQMQDCVQHGFSVFSETFPNQAQAIRLAAFEGWSMEELAQFLSRTPAATREYISQCRKKLKPFLAHCREWLEV